MIGLLVPCTSFSGRASALPSFGQGLLMKHVKFFDHLALAFDAYTRGDASLANTQVQAAFDSPDAKHAVKAMLAHNEKVEAARILAASDIGVEFDVPGDEQRVVPEDKSTSVAKADEVEPEETPAKEPVTASVLKQRYFAAMKR